MFSEVAITFNAATAKNDTTSVAHIWDIRSGVSLASLKHCHASASATSAILPVTHYGGRTCGILVALSDRPTLHYYPWTKHQPLIKMTLPERISAMIVSNSGLFCAAGGESGKLYIWEITTGRLLSVIDAHYRAIRAIKFTIDDRCLVTAGDDALCHSWTLSALFTKSTKPTSDLTLTSHTLPITDIHLSLSLPPTTRAYTSSLDRTVKIWQISRKTLLSTVLFPNPILCITVDPTETRLFAASDSGAIYGVELYPKQSDESRRTMRSEGIEDGGALVYNSHTDKITGLALSFDSTLLISTSMDGTAIVWDVVSRQSLRIFSEHKVPVSGLHVIVRPPDLLNAKSNVKTTTVATFKRYMTSNEGGDAGAGQQDLITIPIEGEIPVIKRRCNEDEGVFAVSLRMARDSDGVGTTLTEVEQLRNETARLAKINKQLRSANDELYRAAIEQFTKQQQPQQSCDLI
ncbi:hypothetical protein SeMB42_g01765 [Synchytrium endobioticum]|uniref:WD repeat-containing protein 54 beta-propeller domain-containing protein n=1 Tax=Synchytrium endobioticum TaxID=286115 RepID=A0A507DJQ1_9FUNG|nr:hypothetical protein SeLEV6574_g02198 [Synchytrium endobioticum]TPX51929.1 hypothetical protein SeMB42_g01765 [Synchytrium endobioticum]